VWPQGPFAAVISLCPPSHRFPRAPFPPTRATAVFPFDSSTGWLRAWPGRAGFLYGVVTDVPLYVVCTLLTGTAPPPGFFPVLSSPPPGSRFPCTNSSISSHLTSGAPGFFQQLQRLADRPMASFPPYVALFPPHTPFWLCTLALSPS